MLATAGPYSDVYRLLDDMKARIVAESAEQAGVYNSQMADCAAEKTLRQGEMQEATAANAAATFQFNSCEAAAIVATSALELNTQTLSNKRQYV